MYENLREGDTAPFADTHVWTHKTVHLIRYIPIANWSHNKK